MKNFILSKIFMFIFVVAINAMANDSSVCITHYNIDLKPLFDSNKLEIEAELKVENLSEQVVDSLELYLLSLNNVREMQVNVLHVVDGTRAQTLPVFKNAMEKGGAYFTVSLPKSLKPQKTTRLIINYEISGKSKDSGLPLYSSAVAELYLLSEFQWLPAIKFDMATQKFADILKPSWDMRIQYPDSLSCVVDGRLKHSAAKDGHLVELWKNNLNGWPQVFISKYDTFVTEELGAKCEIYWPSQLSLEKDAINATQTCVKTVNFYTKKYGWVKGNSFKIIVTNTNGGAHGAAMGLVCNPGQLNDPKTITHEIAHTWWGRAVSSYGEGSKFLREAMANFSSASALKEIQGENASDNLLRSFKIRTLYDYYLANPQDLPKSPLIIQDGFNPNMVTWFNYNKGPLVLKAIKDEMGEKVFFKSTQKFIKKFYNKNANIYDFMKICNTAGKDNFTDLFKDLLWGGDFPQYSTINFKCEQKGKIFNTSVEIKNDGGISSMCEIQLITKAGKELRFFKVPANSQKTLLFLTNSKVENVLIDPNLTCYNYEPDRKIEFWQKFDSDFLGMTNWYWYNKSYSYYLIGEYDMAIKVLNEYLEKYSKSRGWDNIRQGAANDFLAGMYLFSRAYYFGAAGDSVNTLRDIQACMPQLISKLGNKKLLYGALPNTGFITKKSPENDVLDLMTRLTGKKFQFSETTPRETSIKEWQNWWDQNVDTIKLNIKDFKKAS